jgi:aspartate kinase
MAIETDFEKKRGVSRIEVRPGFAQVHVSRLDENLMESRLTVLKALADAQVSIDFLKLTPSGLSCLVSEAKEGVVTAALESCTIHYSVRCGRSIVIVHAVNMRDEEGLIAKVVQQAIASNARIEHICDMHDRMLIVVHGEDAEQLKDWLEKVLVESSAGGRL